MAGYYVRAFFTAAFLIAGSAFASGEDLYYGGFDGTWQGGLKPFDPDLVSQWRNGDRSDINFRFQIKGSIARVFFQSDGAWIEAKNWQFRIAVHKTNAVIYAIDSSSDEYGKTDSGGWVETWNFTVTHKDENGLYATWTRCVNNYIRPPWGEQSGRAFCTSAFGEMSHGSR